MNEKAKLAASGAAPRRTRGGPGDRAAALDITERFPNAAARSAVGGKTGRRTAWQCAGCNPLDVNVPGRTRRRQSRRRRHVAQALYQHPLRLCRGGEGERGDPEKAQRQGEAQSRVGRSLLPPCRPKGPSRAVAFGPLRQRSGNPPEGINDEVIDGFIAAVREGSLHKKPNGLHRQVTVIWNKAAEANDLGLGGNHPFLPEAAKTDSESLLCPSFVEDRDHYLAWCGVVDPFAESSLKTFGTSHVETNKGSDPRCGNGAGQERHEARTNSIACRSGHGQEPEKHLTTASCRRRR